MKAFDIVAYTYKAEQICRDCMYPVSVQISRDAGGTVEAVTVRANLNAAAMYLGIDRDDECSFDSDDFPKVVFASQVQCRPEDGDHDRCDHCDACLLD